MKTCEDCKLYDARSGKCKYAQARSAQSAQGKKKYACGNYKPRSFGSGHSNLQVTFCEVFR